MEIQFDLIGKIIEGDHKGWYVKFIDDFENSGGYYIMEAPDIKFKDGFDSWLESKEQVIGYCLESNWTIKYLD